MLQAEAAAAQRAFEHSRAMLEGQLSQLSSAISSQEALIATLQSNEAEAKNLGALYLVRGMTKCWSGLEWHAECHPGHSCRWDYTQVLAVACLA